MQLPHWVEEHPYYTAGGVVVVGLLLVYLLFHKSGGGASGGSPLGAYYAASAANTQSANALAAVQASEAGQTARAVAGYNAATTLGDLGYHASIVNTAAAARVSDNANFYALQASEAAQNTQQIRDTLAAGVARYQSDNAYSLGVQQSRYAELASENAGAVRIQEAKYAADTGQTAAFYQAQTAQDIASITAGQVETVAGLNAGVANTLNNLTAQGRLVDTLSLQHIAQLILSSLGQTNTPVSPADTSAIASVLHHANA
jgi:predicted peroxiredoxin